MAAVITVRPTVAHVGDVVDITQLGVALGGSSCNVEDGQSFVMYPDGVVANVKQYENGFVINQGQTITCLPAPSGGVVPGCLPVTLPYTIQSADINRPLSFTTPRGFTSGAVPGTAKQVKWLVVSDGVLASSGGTLTAGGQGNAAVLIVTPQITITKECVNPCTPYGSPIEIRGRVCNAGDILLTTVTVTDNPVVTFTFGMVISNGAPVRPFANGGVLFPSECVDYSGSYPVSGNLCGPFTDTATVTAVDSSSATGFIPKTVTASASATCHVSTHPAITLEKDCQPRRITIGSGPQTYVETFTVHNTGDVPLQNVVIHDTKHAVTTDYLCTAGPLAPGASCTFTTPPIPVTEADCPSITDTAVATADNTCPPDAVCPSSATVSSAQATCTVEVVCIPPQPAICISKEVACSPPGGICDGSLTYGETATGVADDANPAFCYKITVSNCGVEPLNKVTVVDPSIPAVEGSFPPNLAVGQTETRYFQKSWGPGTHVNKVTATGTGTNSLIRVTTNDTASVTVLNINIVCDIVLMSSFDMDNNTNDNHVTLPVGSTGVPIQFKLTLRNTGSSPLNVTTIDGLPKLVDCDSGAPIAVTLPIHLDAGASVMISGCADASCPDTKFSVSVHAEADDLGGTLCVYDSTGHRVSDDTSCAAEVTCATPTTCRVTGGGQLLPGFTDQSCRLVETTIIPFTSPNGLTIKKITHGGQLGAPFSHMDCGEILGNPCIRGQWQHTRHYEGKANPRDVIDMDFHSQTPKGEYDSLNCACLGCCDPASGAFIAPITVGSICNPDDHKVCGPQPRPAPANAIIWSGIGKITPVDDVRGSRAAQAEWVVFRVYIEDRSEPGGGHPGGAVEPADIYCFQAWKTGIKVSKKPDFSTIAAEFRTALGRDNCDFLSALSSGTLTIGTLPSPTVAGLVADIQDCGPMHDGNHQIHPATGATCTE